MIYQVRANLFFEQMTDAEDLFKKGALAMVDSVVVHPDDPNFERPRLELIKCYHDEQPTKPCELLDCKECA